MHQTSAPHGRSRLLTRNPLESYSAYLDGHCLSDAEVAALRTWIAADENNAIEFVEFAVLHAAITERLRLDRLLDDLASHRTAGGISPSLLANAIREIELSSPRVLERPQPMEPLAETAAIFPWSTAATFAAVAATLLVAVWGFWRNSPEIPLPQVDMPRPAVASAKQQPPQVVARLATSFDAKWRNGEMARKQKFFAGDTISLSSGVAQFDMEGGAIVVVEGPTEIELSGPDALKLSQGKAAVRVAEQGESFVIDTPTMQVIDLGTEFGVETSASGTAQVMVFDGTVAIGEASAGETSESSAAAAQAPRLEAGYQVSIDANEAAAISGVQPEVLSNPRHFLRPDEIEVRRRALAGSEFDRRLAEHYERQRIDGLLAYQPFDPTSAGREFAIGMGAQGVTTMANVSFVGDIGRGAIDVQNGPAFIWLDTSPMGPLAKAGFLKSNGLVGETGSELWLMWTTKRLQAKPESNGSAGISLMFGDRSDFDEPIFIGRAFGEGEEICMQTAWDGGVPPSGQRVDVDLDANLALRGIQTKKVDDASHRWLARIEFREGTDRVSVWIDDDPKSVDVDAPQAVIDVVDVEFDRLRLAVNREDELWRFSNFAAAAKVTALAHLEKVGAFTIDE
jgi:hypothetical protein